jgi:cytochrome c oxidase subunit 3
MSAQHAGTPGLAHHFNTLEQQQESQTLGMWLFLVTEVMFFGGMFATYGVYRYLYHEGFVMASRQLDVTMGGINTAVLLCSSLAMALAVYSSMHRNRSLTGLFLMLTLVLGMGFLVIKGIEYKHKWEHDLVPGHGFQIHDAQYHDALKKHPELAKRAELFFGLYFTMTGVHAFHMLIGVCVLLLLIYRSVMWDEGPTFMSVELTGLYWHFVDVVWVFLFPLLYLIDRSPK